VQVIGFGWGSVPTGSRAGPDVLGLERWPDNIVRMPGFSQCCEVEDSVPGSGVPAGFILGSLDLR
jgi:hypothetical protein